MFVPVAPLLLMLAGQAAPPQAAPAPPRMPQQAPKLYNEAADARAQIDAALKAAAESDIRVRINWGANDDDACSAFQRAMSGRGSTNRAYQAIRTTLEQRKRKLTDADVNALVASLEEADRKSRRRRT